MQNVSRKLILPYTRKQMFKLVNTVEDYPLFLPWCKSVHVHYQKMLDAAQEIKATMNIAKGPAKFEITTINLAQEDLTPDCDMIKLKLVNGPFRHFNGDWKFTDIENGSSIIDFNMEFQFSNKLFAMALEPVFLGVSSSLVDAFSRRAAEVYST